MLVFAGLQNRAVRAPMVWGAAYIVSAVGLALLTTHGSAPDWISINIANALVLLGSALTWAGARMFDARPVRPGLVLAAPALWLIACVMPAFGADINLRVVLVSALMAMLAAVTAEEFWCGRAEPLMSRWPTVCALLAYAAALLARIPATLLSPILQGQSLMSGVSFALLAFGTLLPVLPLFRSKRRCGAGKSNWCCGLTDLCSSGSSCRHALPNFWMELCVFKSIG